MMKWTVGCILAVFIATPVFAAGEKKVDKETCLTHRAVVCLGASSGITHSSGERGVPCDNL
jgi:hypothetical protein